MLFNLMNSRVTKSLSLDEYLSNSILSLTLFLSCLQLKGHKKCFYLFILTVLVFRELFPIPCSAHHRSPGRVGETSSASVRHDSHGPGRCSVHGALVPGR